MFRKLVKNIGSNEDHDSLAWAFFCIRYIVLLLRRPSLRSVQVEKYWFHVIHRFIHSFSSQPEKFLEKLTYSIADQTRWNEMHCQEKNVKWKRELWIKWLTTLAPVNCKDVRLSNILACYLTSFSTLSIHPNNKVCQVTFLTSLRKNQFTVSRPDQT